MLEILEQYIKWSKISKAWWTQYDESPSGEKDKNALEHSKAAHRVAMLFLGLNGELLAKK